MSASENFEGALSTRSGHSLLPTSGQSAFEFWLARRFGQIWALDYHGSSLILACLPQLRNPKKLFVYYVFILVRPYLPILQRLCAGGKEHAWLLPRPGGDDGGCGRACRNRRRGHCLLYTSPSPR